MCYFEGKILKSSCVVFLRPTTTLCTLIRNAKCTDVLNTMHTCIKAFRLCHRAVSSMSSLICAHISRTLDLVIIVLSYKCGLYIFITLQQQKNISG